MKKSLFPTTLLVALSVLFFSCTKSNDGPEPVVPPVGSSNYSLFVVDSNRIHSVNNDGTNVKLVTKVDQTATGSVYISSISSNPEKTKIVYFVRKGNFPSYVSEIRIVDFNGSNDKLVFAINQNDVFPGKIKYGSNNKLYYTYFQGTTTKFYTIKDDGSANAMNFSQNFEDITIDGKFLVSINPDIFEPSKTSFQVLDLTGDGGAGSSVYFKTFDVQLNSAKIAADGKKAVAVYRDGTNIKIKIADITTQTVVEKTVITGADAYGSLFVSFTPDNKTVICTVGGTLSKSYTYDLEAGNSISNFTNLNKDVSSVYAF